MPNPYTPGNPANPDCFGGRIKILEKVRENIENAREQKRNGGVLVCGHRGVGKSSLIEKAVSLVRTDRTGNQTNALVACRRLSRTTSDQEIYQILIEEMKGQVLERRSIIERMGRAVNRINALKAFEIGIDLEKENNDRNLSPYMQWKTMMFGLQNADYVLIALDDADYLSPEALSELKTIV